MKKKKTIKKEIREVDVLVSKSDPILGQRFETKKVSFEEIIETVSVEKQLPIIKEVNIKKSQKSAPKPALKRSGTREGRD